MANTYLTTSFQERFEAKTLGARWDAVRSKWFVPDGRDLAPFAKWLAFGAETVSLVQRQQQQLAVKAPTDAAARKLAHIGQGSASQSGQRGAMRVDRINAFIRQWVQYLC